MKPLYLAATAVALIFYCVYTFTIPQAIFSDSAWGFLTAKSMEAGAPFNHYIEPDMQNISKDVFVFQTWWTPGQYLIPTFFSNLLSINLGWAIFLTTLLSSILGLFGFIKLYKHFGYSGNVLGISILLIVCHRTFSFPFTVYHGGEVLLFGFLPWIYYLMLRKAHNITYLNVVFFSVIGIVGFVCKSSVLVSLLAIIISMYFIFVSREFSRKNLLSTNVFDILKNKKLFTHGFKLGLTLMLTVIPIYLIFLSKGTTPSTTVGVNFNLMDIVFPLSSPLSVAFSLDDIINRIFIYPGYNYAYHFNTAWIYLILSILFICIFYLIIQRKLPNAEYRIVLICAFFIFVSFFTYVYTFGANISYESRHFRILGLLFLPALVSFGIENKRRFVPQLSYIVIACVSLYGISSFIHRKHHIASHYTLCDDNYFMEIEDEEAFEFLKQLDQSETSSDKLIYVYSPEIAMQIKQSRYISSYAKYENEAILSSRKYEGTAGQLYLFVPASFKSEGKLKAITGSFPGYSHWTEMKSTANYLFLLADN